MPRLCFFGFMAAAGLAAHAGANGPSPDAPAPRLRFSAALQPGAEQPEPARDEDPPVAIEEELRSRIPARFGEQGSTWWTFGAGAGYDLEDSTDYGAHVSFSYFLVDDFEITGELVTWFHDQEHEDELGINPVLLFRWHLLNRESWTFYVDAGIGLLFNTDSVPEGGTHINFTPRVGLGFTHALGSGGARLQGGLRWHHISNARITGDRGNPARDAPFFYAGIIIPF